MSGIMRFEWVDPNDLRKNPANWRRHPGLQREALEDLVFGEGGVGWAGAALLNERLPEDGWPAGSEPTLIDGHLRQEVALTRGEPVPVLIGSWSPADEKTILATLDPIAALAEVDVVQLDELLRGVPSTIESPPVATLLEDLASKAGVIDFRKTEDGSPAATEGTASTRSSSTLASSGDYDDEWDDDLETYDASKVQGAVSGEPTNLSYILYVSFPDQDSFRRGVEVLSLGDRTGFIDGQRYANLDGAQLLDVWVEALGDPDAEEGA